MSIDDRIGELLKLAGRREMPDAEQTSRARAAARAEWMQVATRRRRIAGLVSGSAVLAAIVLIAALWRPRSEETVPLVPPAARVATLQPVIGAVLVTRDGVQHHIANEPGFEIVVGDRIETLERSFAGLSLEGGTSVKLDRGSIVVAGTASALVLDRGAIFVDVGVAASGADLHIRTPLAVVRHVGTQFETRLHGDALQVRVRDGSVAVENEDGQWISREGEALRVTRGEAPERQSIRTYGAEWAWVDNLAPPFVLEGATLAAFLEWVSHHHGLRWRYANPELRDRTAQTILHGSIEGLSAEEALAAVLRTCGLTLRRIGELLIIARP